MKTVHRRVAFCYFTVLVAMFLTVLRVVDIALDPRYFATANSTASRSITITGQRGTIYDCNMEPLTNSKENYLSLVTDIPSATVTLKNYYSEAETALLLAELQENSVPIITTERDITGNGIISFGYLTNNQSIANHIIGYTDQEGHGVSGLQYVFDDILYSESKVRLTFGIDGNGDIIKGDSIKFEINRSVENSGIALTLDSEIQRIAEAAAEDIFCGAVAVVEVETGEIKAMVSRPDFELDNLAAALEDENSPLINRVMQTYNVGSVFKPCVAAAAIEAGEGGFLFNCEGASDIDGQIFRCHKAEGHEWLDMAGAIKHSCNSFFYNLAVKVGATPIFEMAQNAGFNNAVSLGYGVSTKSAQIGNYDRLEASDRALANLSIGQGELMVSPLGILTLYCAIATDGSYYPLSLIKGEVKNGSLINKQAQNAKVKLMKASTAERLRDCLARVLEEDGTGFSAKPKTVSAAGKTSTAETGIFKDGKRVINSWFCGFFPFEDPKYAVAVISENSSKGCGGVFAKIADSITDLKNK